MNWGEKITGKKMISLLNFVQIFHRQSEVDFNIKQAYKTHDFSKAQTGGSGLR